MIFIEERIYLQSRSMIYHNHHNHSYRKIVKKKCNNFSKYHFIAVLSTFLFFLAISFLLSCLVIKYLSPKLSRLKSANNKSLLPKITTAVPDFDTLSSEYFALDNDITMPSSVMAIAKNIKNSFRNFNLYIYQYNISPKKFAVLQNDIVTLKVTSLDRNYVLLIPQFNVKLDIKAGETKIAQFQAVTPGVADLECISCGLKKQGVIIIKPNNQIKSLTNIFHAFHDTYRKNGQFQLIE